MDKLFLWDVSYTYTFSSSSGSNRYSNINKVDSQIIITKGNSLSDVIDEIKTKLDCQSYFNEITKAIFLRVISKPSFLEFRNE